MKRNLIETILGAVVLFVAIFFVVTTYNSSGVKNDYAVKLWANFDKVDGITNGSDVRLGGIKIGTVIGLDLDPKTYRAKLDLGIQDKIGIPTDSSAVIASDGLLGGKYIDVIPGAENDMLKTGGQIQFTQSSVNLEEMIGKFAFGSAGGGSGDKNSKADEKTSLNTTPPVTPAPVAETIPKKVTPEPTQSSTLAPTKKADIVDINKPNSATPIADSEPVALPKADQPPPATPTPPNDAVITPKIVKVPLHSGDAE